MDAGKPPPETPAAALPIPPLPALALLALCLLLFSILSAAAESALLSINKLRIRFLRTKRDKRARRTAALLDNKTRVLNALLVSNNVANIAFTMLVTAAFFDRFGAASAGIAALVSALILLMLGEIVPKTVAASNPERVALSLSGFIAALTAALTPVSAVCTAFSRAVSHLFGIRLEKQAAAFTQDEIKTFLDVGTEEGVVSADSGAMMRRAFSFADIAAKELMTPRTKIVSVGLGVSYRAALELAERSRLSRFPVCRKGIDDIVGVLYIKDLLFFSGNAAAFSVQAAMRPPFFIPGTKKLSSVQELLRAHRETLAIVVDEYSGTSGIITAADIAQQVFGVSSGAAENAAYARAGQRRNARIADGAVLDGQTRLADMRESLGIPLASSFETLGGFIMERLDAVPQVGDCAADGGYRFTVDAADGNRATAVRVEKA